MKQINCRIDNSTGRITLTRPKSLNALSYEMCHEIESALIRWIEEDQVTQVIIDGEGEKAFCAGGYSPPAGPGSGDAIDEVTTFNFTGSPIGMTDVGDLDVLEAPKMIISASSMAVSYTHLTLPTNREV